jgi:hypothetical protein
VACLFDFKAGGSGCREHRQQQESSDAEPAGPWLSLPGQDLQSGVRLRLVTVRKRTDQSLDCEYTWNTD